MRDKVLVWGGGDLGSGVARRLYKAGFQVLVIEQPQPRAIRLEVAFAKAVYTGKTQVEDVWGFRLSQIPDQGWVSGVGVMVDPDGKVIHFWKPRILVDARLLKSPNHGLRKGLVPFSVGLGPGFFAGRDVDAVVETKRGHHLGRVIWEGEAEKNTGIPGEVLGYREERVLRAPQSGIFQREKAIGDKVEAGESIAMVGTQPLQAKISGVIRGLLWDGLEVKKGEKVGDIDPRGIREYAFTVSDKANAVAGGVLEAIFTYLHEKSNTPHSD